MSIVERFTALKNRRFTDEDGEEYTLELSPPLSDTEIAALEKRIPCPIPSDIRALLKVTGGFESGPLDTFDVAGTIDGGFGLEEIFPCGLPIAHDGYGNYWVVDLLPTSTTWGPIYYACHDAPVIVYQCADLGQFLDAIIEMTQPPHKGSIDFVHENASHAVWTTEPNAIDRATAVAHSDPELRAFAETLDDAWTFIDLRKAKMGDGFAWGRAGSPAPDNIKRWKTLPLFAYRRKKSILKRLFGK